MLQVAGALDRKERLLNRLRVMNDEAEKAGPDGRKTQPSDTFRQAYADVVMKLKQVGHEQYTVSCMLVYMFV